MIQDPTQPDPTPAPPVAQPPVPPSPHSPLNPALLGNVSIIGAYALGAICLIGAIVLAVVHDGQYTQAAFELFRDVLLIVAGGGSITGVAHVITRRGVNQ